MLNLAKQIFGSVNERKVRVLRPQIQRINALEGTFEALSDEALRNKTSEYRQRLARGGKIDEVLPEAFATVREASKRVLGMRVLTPAWQRRERRKSLAPAGAREGLTTSDQLPQ